MLSNLIFVKCSLGSVLNLELFGLHLGLKSSIFGLGLHFIGGGLFHGIEPPGLCFSHDISYLGVDRGLTLYSVFDLVSNH